MLDFICIGFAELWGTGSKRKIQNEMYVSSGIRTNNLSHRKMAPNTAQPRWQMTKHVKKSYTIIAYDQYQHVIKHVSYWLWLDVYWN